MVLRRYAIDREVLRYRARDQVVPQVGLTIAVQRLIREISEAIRFHVESLREHHEPVPAPRGTATVVDVVAVPG